MIVGPNIAVYGVAGASFVSVVVVAVERTLLFWRWIAEVDFEGWKLDGCCLFSLMNSVDYGSRYGSVARVPVEGDGGFCFQRAVLHFEPRMTDRVPNS